MATDYDSPRRGDEVEETDSIEQLQAASGRSGAGTAVDIDETEAAESLELPGADLSGEELTVQVVPLQTDEFTCGRCFLVHHHSQLALSEDGILVCRDCVDSGLRPSK